jgi:Kef-type K+ transport system membrane component KefB
MSWGILVRYFGEAVDHHTLDFVREFGLILFVFTIGLQVRPGLIAALRQQGVKLTMLAAAIVIPGAAGVTARRLMAKLPDFQIAPGQKRRRWVEPIMALLMALATFATAWCSYESAAWTRRSNRLLNEYNALERQAGLLSLQGIQTATIHTAMFMQLLAAKEAGNDRLAKFYAERFPADVWKAYDGWLA